MTNLDWRWLRSFVAVADAASMQAAALESGISQPTLSRHVKQLEDELDMTLFDRAGPNLSLSDKGRALYEQAKSVRDAVAGFERLAMGASEDTAGTVRVSMHCMLGYHFAPPWLRALRSEHPQISVDLTIDDRANLLLREAEIAIRTSRPAQLDVIAQRVGRYALGLYASEAYLAEHDLGAFHNLLSHELVGFDGLTAFVDNARALGFDIDRESFAARTDLWAVHPVLIERGVGMGVIPISIGEAMGLVRVFPEFSMDGDELFLTAHPDLRRSPRVEIVWDHLREALEAWFGGPP